MAEKCRKSRMRMLLRMSFCVAMMALMVLVGVVMASAEVYTGTCGANGDNLTWTLDTETGVLVISGEGNMQSYRKKSSPWYSYNNCINTVVVNKGVKNIGSYAFYCQNELIQVNLPEGLSLIEPAAFYRCVKIEQMTIPESVSSFGEQSFALCKSLKTINIPQKIQGIEDQTFQDCYELESIILPDGIKYIGYAAFNNCLSISEIVLPNSLDEIRGSAFSGCTGLEEITIPTSVTSITSYVFSGCNLSSVCFNNTNNWSTNGIALDLTDPYNNAVLITKTYCSYRFWWRCTPTQFTTTFIADGEIVATVPYWNTDHNIEIPSVPQKPGYTGVWEDFDLTDGGNITVNAIYTSTMVICHLDPTTGLWVDDNGTLAQGFAKCDDGELRYCIDGVPQRQGAAVDADGYVYYFNSTLKAVRNCTYSIGASMTNGLIPAGTYTVDEQGRLVDGRGELVRAETAMADGFKYFADGTIQYYVDGKPARAGLVADEAGNLYYINSTLKAVRGTWYSFSETMSNGLLPAGTYYFDESGKLVLE